MGAALETDNESGYSHLTEHLVFKSTKKFPDNKIMETAAWIGGNINAYTEFDSTCFYITLPADKLEQGIEIISELGQNANFNDEEFYSEKQVVLQEKYQYEDDTEDSFIENIAKHYFDKNRYGKPILGTKESLNNATPQKLRDFYNKYYRPNNSFLVITGDFQAKTLYKTVEKYFGNWKKKKVNKIPYQKDNWKSGFKFFKKSIEDNYLAFVFPEFNENDKNSWFLSAAINMFASGKKSRLYKRLFIKEQLVDSIKIQSIAGVNDGISIIIVIPKNKASLNRIIDVFYEELEKVIKTGFTQDELEKYKKEQIYNFRYSKEYMEALAMSIGMEEVLSSYKNFEKYTEHINAITLENVSEISRKYMTEETLYIYQTGKNKIEYKRRKPLLSSSKIIPKDVWETQIASGTKIIFKKSDKSETVGIAVSLPVSQLYEDVQHRGINSFTLAMLLYGNQKRNYEDFLNYARDNGIAVSVSARMDSSLIKIKCFKENIDKAINLLSDMLFLPTFPKEHFENLKNTNLSMLSKIKNYPNYYSVRLWKEFYFGKNSNLISSEGLASTIKKISLKKIKEWYHTHYIPQNMNIAVVGDFNFEKVYSFLEENFNTQPYRDYRHSKKIILSIPEKRYKEKNINLTQAYINFGGKGLTLQDKNQTAFAVLSQILGGNADPILFKEIREKRSWAYSVDFDIVKTTDLGYFLINAIVEKKYYKKTISLIKEILTNQIDKNLVDYYLPRLKTYIKGQKIMDEESVLSQAISLSQLSSIGKDYSYYLNWEKRLNGVSTKMILDVSAKIFKEENFYVYVLR